MAPQTLAHPDRACQAERNEARADRSTIDAIEEAMRAHLLAALSEARTLSLKMDAGLREKLMADLTENFHPDQKARDAFTDGFYDARLMADERVEDVRPSMAAE